MFIERLSRISNRIPGAQLLALIAGDGIPVESVSSSAEAIELDALAAELVAQMGEIAENHRELAVGDVRCLSLEVESRMIMVSVVTNGYYLLLITSTDTHRGRARFELRRARLVLEEDLL